jgi:hypothetical protein
MQFAAKLTGPKGADAIRPYSPFPKGRVVQGSDLFHSITFRKEKAKVVFVLAGAD